MYQTKGDLAVAKAVSMLTEIGFKVFMPLICEHLPFDIAGYRDGKFVRFQSKFCSKGTLKNTTEWTSINKVHQSKYKDDDFDYYAAYLPEKDVVCFPSFKFGGFKLTSSVPNSAMTFYWYEDFLDLTDNAQKRSYKDFGFELTRGPRLERRKVQRPNKEDLEKMIWSFPMKELVIQFGVSDKAISK